MAQAGGAGARVLVPRDGAAAPTSPSPDARPVLLAKVKKMLVATCCEQFFHFALATPQEGRVYGATLAFEMD
jgi:hypothetical protein